MKMDQLKFLSVREQLNKSGQIHGMGYYVIIEK